MKQFPSVARQGNRAAASMALLWAIAGTWHSCVLEVCAQDQPRAAAGGTVVARGWAPHRGRIELDADHAVLDVQLQRGNPVQIRFEDESGRPVPEVYVSIEEWRGAKSLYTHRHPNVVDLHVPHQADQNGVYKWTWAPDDKVTYQVGKQGYASQSVPLGPGEHVIKLSK